MLDENGCAERSSATGHKHLIWARTTEYSVLAIVTQQQHLTAGLTGWDSVEPAWAALYLSDGTKPTGYLSCSNVDTCAVLGILVDAAATPAEDAAAANLAAYCRAHSVQLQPSTPQTVIYDFLMADGSQSSSLTSVRGCGKSSSVDHTPASGKRVR